MEAQVQELARQRIEAHGIVADAAVKESLAKAHTELNSTFSSPDVLVYNAGANTIANPSELADEDLLSDFTINVVGA